jgi:hypothetical protein
MKYQKELHPKVIRTTECPECVVNALGWEGQNLVAAHGYTLCENGGLVKEVSDGKLTKISYSGKLKDIRFAIPVDDIGEWIFKISKRKIGPTARVRIRQLALENFWVSCLVRAPDKLVNQIFKQLPPKLVEWYPAMAASKRIRRKAEEIDIIPVYDWIRLVGLQELIDEDQTAPNLLKPKVGLQTYGRVATMDVKCEFVLFGPTLAPNV